LVAESQALAEALFNSCQAIEAKHQIYTDRLNDDRLTNMTLEAVAEFALELDHSGSGVTQAERSAIVGLLATQMAKDNNLPALLYEKFEAHLKLVRYEQRAFNQLRKISQMKKITKRSQKVWRAINRFIARIFKLFKIKNRTFS
jgi:hypothetical protein